MDIQAGMRVYFKPEWENSKGESERVTFVALNAPDKGRFDVRAQLGLPINPTSTVTVDMIERVES